MVPGQAVHAVSPVPAPSRALQVGQCVFEPAKPAPKNNFLIFHSNQINISSGYK